MSAYVRYAEDLTGVNPDNKVSGELHNLSSRPIRVIVPKYGPFYVDSMQVYDAVTQQPLVKGIDWRAPIISREATLRTGMEVCDALLIENANVSGQVHITYQNLGGIYQNNIDNIVSIYESFLNDNRTVDWTDGIYGKPTEFPPALHPHWLSEMYGFEPLTVQLERIQQAILLGNTGAFEQLLTAIDSKGATIAEMATGKPLNKFVTLTGLLSILNKYNFNSMVVKPATTVLKNGQDLWVGVTASFVEENTQYYWSIEHETSSPGDFAALTGFVSLVNGVGSFLVQTTMDEFEEESEYFRIAIRRNSGTGQIVAMSQRLTLQAHVIPPPDSIFAALQAVGVGDPGIQRTAKTIEIVRKVKNASYT